LCFFAYAADTNFPVIALLVTLPREPLFFDRVEFFMITILKMNNIDYTYRKAIIKKVKWTCVKNNLIESGCFAKQKTPNNTVGGFKVKIRP
jgi:hypothetical protein